MFTLDITMEPKITFVYQLESHLNLDTVLTAFFCGYHEDKGSEDNGTGICFREDGLHRSKERRALKAGCEEGKIKLSHCFAVPYGT
jgi:hypothetical protein